MTKQHSIFVGANSQQFDISMSRFKTSTMAFKTPKVLFVVVSMLQVRLLTNLMI